jgi:uncharacterized protein YraI
MKFFPWFRPFLLALIAMATSSAVAETRMQVAVGSTPVYSAPSTDAHKLGNATSGHILFVERVDGDWAAIAPPESVDLWLNKDFIEGNRVVAKSIQVRAGPGIQYDAVGTLERGAPVMPRGEEGEWCKISPPSSSILWVRKNDLSEVAAHTAPIGAVATVPPPPEPVAAPTPAPVPATEVAAVPAPETEMASTPEPILIAASVPNPTPPPAAPAPTPTIVAPAPAAPVPAATVPAPTQPRAAAAPAPIAAAKPQPVPQPQVARAQPKATPRAMPPAAPTLRPATSLPSSAPRTAATGAGAPPPTPQPVRPRVMPVVTKAVPATAGTVAAHKSRNLDVQVDPALVEDLDLADLPNQGKGLQVEGELRNSPFMAASPSRYRLVDEDEDGMIEMVCHVHGNPEELRQYVGQGVSIRGREYWVEDSDMPVVVVGRIVPLAPANEPVTY